MTETVPMYRKPSAVDVHVGGRMRVRRKVLGMSQDALARALGITFQQVQKYERGDNRVSASKLYAMAQFLGVPISFFFDGLEEAHGAPPLVAEDGIERSISAFLNTPEGAELARVFPKINRPRMRRQVLELVRAAAEEERPRD